MCHKFPIITELTHLLLQVEDLVEQVLQLEVEGVHLALARRRRLPAAPRPQLVQPVQLLQGQRRQRRLDPQLGQVGGSLRTLLDLKSGDSSLGSHDLPSLFLNR